MTHHKVYYHPKDNKLVIHFLGKLIWHRKGQRLFDADSIVTTKPASLGYVLIGDL